MIVFKALFQVAALCARPCATRVQCTPQPFSPASGMCVGPGALAPAAGIRTLAGGVRRWLNYALFPHAGSVTALLRQGPAKGCRKYLPALMAASSLDGCGPQGTPTRKRPGQPVHMAPMAHRTT